MEKEKRRRAYKGLHMMRGKWRATIELPDTFDSVEDAARCRQEAEKALMESIAKLSTKRAQQQSPAARRSKLRTAAGGLRSAAKLNSVSKETGTEAVDKARSKDAKEHELVPQRECGAKKAERRATSPC